MPRLSGLLREIGKKEVVANGIYSDSFFGRLDINGDGVRD